jgi:hypothetical protein
LPPAGLGGRGGGHYEDGGGLGGGAHRLLGSGLGEFVGVEDEGDAAIAEDGGTGDAFDLTVEGTELFDDGFVIADDFVDDKAAVADGGLGDEDLPAAEVFVRQAEDCLLYTSPSPRDV